MEKVKSVDEKSVWVPIGHTRFGQWKFTPRERRILFRIQHPLPAEEVQQVLLNEPLERLI